jgi:hypothetical protein
MKNFYKARQNQINKSVRNDWYQNPKCVFDNPVKTKKNKIDFSRGKIEIKINYFKNGIPEDWVGII